jgi:hypothetical protein
VFCALANGLPQTLIIRTTTTQISRWAAFMMSFSGSISHFAERLFRFRREAGGLFALLGCSKKGHRHLLLPKSFT